MEVIAPDGRSVFCSRVVIAGEAVLALMFGLVGWGVAAGAAPNPWNGLVFVVGLVATVLAVVRAFRISLVVESSGLTIKNYWRTHWIAWSDVTAVRDSWTTMGPVPVRALVITCDRRRLFARVLASAGNGQGRADLAALLRERPEMHDVPIDLKT